MSYTVSIKRKALKRLQKLPQDVQETFEVLRRDLSRTGPVQRSWPNYSKLGEVTHHCHLKYSWVAVWRENENNELILEVTYVGSREDAPY